MSKTPSTKVVGTSRDAPVEPAVMPGLTRTDDQLILATDSFTLEPGQEKYMCWTAKVDSAIKVRSY